LLAAALLVSAWTLLDARRAQGLWLGPALALLGWVSTPRPRRARVGLAALLAGAWGLGAAVGPEFRADAPEFFVYLPSLIFDRDLDLHDDWLQMGFDEGPPRTPLGLTRNRHAIGPALVWSPFYLAAHGYVLGDHAWGSGRYTPDGHSAPYRRACAWGTLSVVVWGAWLLARALAVRHGAGPGALAALASVVASPALHYALGGALMSHGLAYGLSAALLWALVDLDDERPGAGARFWRVGLLGGLLVCVRWSAVVHVLLVAPVALVAWRRGRLNWRQVGLAALLALLACLPQMLAWRVLFGAALTMPQGSGFIDWRTPHLLDTLISADRGLFTWTPLLWLGAVGLLLAFGRGLVLPLASLATCVASAWINGGAADWAAGEAFGARRYDAVLPLLALGLAAAFGALRNLVQRRPLLVPAALVLLAAAWNAGLLALFQEQRYSGPVRVEQVAAGQARLARRAAEDVLGTLFGAAGRAFAYRALAGDYLYSPARPDGRIVLAQEDDADLSGRWSPARRGSSGPSFRWVFAPGACLTLPLDRAADLRLRFHARAAAQPLEARVRVNDTDVGALTLGADWSESSLVLPGAYLHAGANQLCLLTGPVAPEIEDQPVLALSSVAGP
jgi:hypothetical protein